MHKYTDHYSCSIPQLWLVREPVFIKAILNAAPVSNCFDENEIVENATRLPRDLQQGQLVIGYTTPGSHVRFNDHNWRVNRQGEFKFRIPSDAADFMLLQITLPNHILGFIGLSVTRAQRPFMPVNAAPQPNLALNQQTRNQFGCNG